jgi:hypothetical protein
MPIGGAMRRQRIWIECPLFRFMYSPVLPSDQPAQFS